MEILKKKWTIGTNSLKLLGVSHWTSVGSRVDWSFIVLEGRGGLIVSNHDCYCIAVVAQVDSICSSIEMVEDIDDSKIDGEMVESFGVFDGLKELQVRWHKKWRDGKI